jgi:predicted DsbA family dithiol-disulfide isomerase
MPAAGMPLDEYLEKRFGSAEKLQPAMDELTQIGKAEGVNFNFDKLERVPNSLDAHRLMKLAETGEISTSDLAEAEFTGCASPDETGRDRGNQYLGPCGKHPARIL